MIIVVTVLMLALLAPATHCLQIYNSGAGLVYKLDVKQDVSIERPSSNYNYLKYLIVSRHPQFPNKRSLVQFEDLPPKGVCQVIAAKMYLYYAYAHKPSWHTIYQTPFIRRYLQVRLVLKSWKEAEATSTKRDNTNLWTTEYLGLDGTDAAAVPQTGTVTIFPYRPSGFVEFDVTDAVQRWKSGVPNNGLVIRATNELDDGRDIRFFSNAEADATKHAYVLVLCSA